MAPKPETPIMAAEITPLSSGNRSPSAEQGNECVRVSVQGASRKHILGVHSWPVRAIQECRQVAAQVSRIVNAWNETKIDCGQPGGFTGPRHDRKHWPPEKSGLQQQHTCHADDQVRRV